MPVQATLTEADFDAFETAEHVARQNADVAGKHCFGHAHKAMEAGLIYVINATVSVLVYNHPDSLWHSHSIDRTVSSSSSPPCLPPVAPYQYHEKVLPPPDQIDCYTLVRQLLLFFWKTNLVIWRVLRVPPHSE